MKNAWRVVIFEDDFLLVEALSDALAGLGCVIAHCCGNVRDAMLAVEAADFDLAIVDLNLRGLDAFPILDRLVESNVLTLVATASDKQDIPERFAQLPRLCKPYNQKQLKQAIEQMQTAGLLRAV